MVNLPVIGFTRLHTLASLLWPALRFRSLACLHYGFACSLARLLHGAQSYDPNPNQSVLSCGESHRSGSETAAAAAAPTPVVPISPASPSRTLLAARASTHPAPLAWAAPSLRSACSCRVRHRSRTPVDEPASLRLCQRRRWSLPSRRTPRQLAPAALLAARAAPAKASCIRRLQNPA